MMESFAAMADPISMAGDDGGTRESEDSSALTGLGRREREVLGVMRKLDQASVQDVCERLNAGLAYTTVMTTLDRLFRKGLLERRKQGRAFIYRTALSAKDMEERRAAEMVRRFFGDSDAQREVLLSCLVDAVHGYDAELLDGLEAMIREAREQAQKEEEQ